MRSCVTGGCYSSTAPFTLAAREGVAGKPREVAADLAAKLSEKPWIASVEVTGPGYLTITVTRQAREGVPARIIAAGDGCLRSDALAGQVVSLPPKAAPAGNWSQARDALAREITPRLAEAAGAASPPQTPVIFGAIATKITGVSGPAGVWEAVAYAGEDAVRFALARTPPGRPVRTEPENIARHLLGNPAYAVRYAHSRAASVPRWAPAAGSARPAQRQPGERGQDPGVLDPGELALADTLSWLPERVAVAARRARPDEFARYLEELAYAIIGTLGPASNLELAAAARTGLAAGLGLLGIATPERL
jgi:arginyl-tRNA synthetase